MMLKSNTLITQLTSVVTKKTKKKNKLSCELWFVLSNTTQQWKNCFTGWYELKFYHCGYVF